MPALEDEIKQEKFKSSYHKLMLNLIFTGNWIQSAHARHLKQFGLSTQQFNILRILRGQHPDPATVNLLQERMLDRMSNASRLVEKLRRKGLLERHTCPNDRRAVDIVITQKGLALLDEIDDLDDGVGEQLADISESEARRLNAMLDKIREIDLYGGTSQ